MHDRSAKFLGGNRVSYLGFFCADHLQSEIFQMVGKRFFHGRQCRFTLISFGFKHGRQPKSDFKVDVRFLPNPYYLMNLRLKNVTHKDVQKYLLKKSAVRSVIEHLFSEAKEKFKRSKRKSKRSFVLAVGCTGGRHRSVAIVES